MVYLVQKFGGTSVADLGRIQHVAQTVLQEVQAGYQVVVVVSAMAGVTNQLVTWTQEACPGGDRGESDMVLASGEQVTAGLLALALQNLGLKARSWLGWQIPILTTADHGNARIVQIKTQNLKKALAQGEIAIVAGFQGTTAQGRLTTLGRGGSDTTAVALAAFLKAERCDIYTDVEGVYTADPRWVNGAKKLASLSYEEMFTLASHGAKVLHPQAVAFAQKENVPVRILSSLSKSPGTLIFSSGASEQLISGITHAVDILHVTLKGLPPTWHAGALHQYCQKNHIPLDMLTVKLTSLTSSKEAAFILPGRAGPAVLSFLKKMLTSFEGNAHHIEQREEFAQVSVIKGSLRGHIHHLRHHLLETLLMEKIPIYGLSTAPLKMSVLVEKMQAPQVLHLLHQAYGLEAA